MAAAQSTPFITQSVTYNANGVVDVTVAPQQAGVPTVGGNVTLTIDSNTYTATLDANGKASFTVTSPSAGAISFV